MRHSDLCRIRDIAGFRVDYLISGRCYRADDQVDRFAHSDGDDALFFEVVVNFVIALHIAADGAPQSRSTEVAGVTGASAFDGVDTALSDRPRSGEIRFAHAEAYHVLHLGHQIEEGADAAFGQGRDVVGNELTG